MFKLAISFSLITLLVGCRTIGSIGSLPIHNLNVPSTPPAPAKRYSYEAIAVMSYLKVIDSLTDIKDCKLLGSSTIMAQPKYEALSEAKRGLKYQAMKKDADSIYFNQKEAPPFTPIEISANFYKCNTHSIPPVSEVAKVKKLRHENSDFDIFTGAYLHRDGILRQVGETGPTFGLSLTTYKKSLDNGINKHGMFFLWSFDHFWRTNSKLLKPQFYDKDFTNYMLGFGYAYRHIFNSKIQFHYKGGLVINFIEIDTFGGGDVETDREYSDVTGSTIHKLGIDYLIRERDNPLEYSQLRLGPSIMYYYSPNLLGKFGDESNDRKTGGSLAWSLDLKIEFY